MNNKLPRRSIALVLFTYALSFSCLGAVINWNTTTGAWGTAANWNPNTAVPGINDLARVNNGGTAQIADGLSYAVSNLWVGANSAGNTGTVQITSGVLSVTGGSGATRPQIGVGSTTSQGTILVDGGTLQRASATPMLLGGNKGRGFLTVSSGNVFLDQLRIGSDNAQANTGGTGRMDVSGGLVVITNQFTVGRDLDNGYVTISGGQVINHASNFLAGITTDDFITIAGGTGGSTGVVQVTSGGVLRAEGGIRLAQAGTGDTSDGTLQVFGGKLVTHRLVRGAATGISVPKVQLDNAIVEAYYPTNANGFIYEDLLVTVKAGGVTIDSQGYDLLVTPGFLVDGSSPGGGITKSNAGTLKLVGTNTYTGSTVVWGGGLLIANASSGGGSITIQDGCGFGARVSYKGASMPVSTLTLNGGSAGTNDLNFELGTLGNPTAAVISANSFVVNPNRTNIVNLSGAGLSVGKITLIAFTSGATATIDKFEMGILPLGVEGNLLIEGNALKFDVTTAPSLHWNGAGDSTDWSTNGTLNWLDFSQSPAVAATYYDGAAVSFDDAAATNWVELAHALQPASVTVSNSVVDYTFSGIGYLTGNTGLEKKGSKVLTLATTNNYAGDTIVSAGTLKLGASDVLPSNPVVLSGTMDMNGFSDTIGHLSGTGTVDNSLVGVFSQLTINVTGAGTTFDGTFMNSGGALTVVKTGNNPLTLTGNNTHSGGTRIDNGIIVLGGDNTLGTGTFTLDGSSDPSVTSDSTSPRVITNDVVITTASEIGDALKNGLLTFSGPVSFNGAVRNLTCSSEVIISGFSSSGGVNKRGTANLRLQGAHQWSAESDVQSGTLYLENAFYTNSAGLRPNCNQANGMARLSIGQGSFYVLTGTSVNLRIGATGGNNTATNITDLDGTAFFPNSGTANGRVVIGQGGTIGIFNLLANGLAIVRSVVPSTSPGYCEANFLGGTLQAVNSTPNFMEGLSNAFIHPPGGLKIDSAGFDIGINQALRNAGGGLTKLGAGTLSLNGINDYVGTTDVQAGGLGGTGTIAGPVQVGASASLAPGNPLGTLTVNNTVTLNGTSLMKVSRDGGTPASGTLSAMSIMRAGNIIVTNAGIAALQSGDSFNLFDWTSLGGTPGSLSLPPLLPGLSWDPANLWIDGTITITGTAIPPTLAAPVVSGGSVNVTGSGGVADGTYYVLTSTDLTVPVSSWTTLSTNVFDGSGNFSFSDPVVPGELQRFYLISLP